MYKKKAFNLTEILIVLALIGVVIYFELATLDGRRNQYGASYYNVYTALKKTTYNILADMYCPDPKSTDAACKTGPRPFPENSYDLCNRMIEFLNVLGDTTNCGTDANDKSLDINNTMNNFDPEDKNVRFRTANGYKFYLSGLKTFSGSFSSVKYFIVYVDLNGDEKPNRVGMTANDKVFPDIVPFAMTISGPPQLIPIGYPIYSQIYLSAKVRLPATLDSSGNIKDNIFTAPMTFYDAIATAYGKMEKADTPESLPFNRELKNNVPQNSPQGFFISQIPNKKDDELNAKEAKRNENCGNDEAICGVVVDSYIGKRF